MIPAGTLGAAACCLALLTPAAGAQDAPGATPPVAGEAMPLLLDGTRLRPDTLHYRVLVRTDTSVQLVGMHTVTIGATSFSGQPAWEVIESRESEAPFVARSARDSVVLDHVTLAPLRWEATAGGARFVAAFANDSIYGGASAPGARATFTLGAPPQAVTSEGALLSMLQAAELEFGTTAGLTMLVAGLDGARVLPFHISVEREEAVTVPAGQFRTLVVRARSGETTRWLWIARDSRLVVRTVEHPAFMPGLTVERVLVEDGSP